MAEVKIESIKIKIGKKEMTLSIDEAKQLKSELDSVLGAYIPYVSNPYIYTNPEGSYDPSKLIFYTS